MQRFRAGALCLALLLLLPGAAALAQKAPEDRIRATVSRWYVELAKKDEGRLNDIVAPDFIDATPHYRYLDTGSRAAGPRVYTSLPARALKFSYQIEAIRLDRSFAKVRVWERGYFYAWAAQKTYEQARETVFVLERSERDGRWRILAHQSGSYGIPPNKVTDPMPDLRALFYATEGKDRDPAKDAAEAGKF